MLRSKASLTPVPIFRWITNAQAAERMVLLARTTPLEKVEKTNPSKGLSLFYCDFARGKREGSVVVQPIHKMGGRAVDANQVGFTSVQGIPI